MHAHHLLHVTVRVVPLCIEQMSTLVPLPWPFLAFEEVCTSVLCRLRKGRAWWLMRWCRLPGSKHQPISEPCSV